MRTVAITDSPDRVSRRPGSRGRRRNLAVDRGCVPLGRVMLPPRSPARPAPMRVPVASVMYASTNAVTCSPRPAVESLPGAKGLDPPRELKLERRRRFANLPRSRPRFRVPHKSRGTCRNAELRLL